ncbi:DUF1992 domain-containing protein [Fictibacillus sp. Mic-4]|uniref:DnaJ family domain-containing protein n=1 Tax=Fictibacillus sp. Mic-4 TaxID=3132826 RepID=UPI003CF87EFF
MKKDQLEKELQKKEILMKDEQTGWYYEDHITAIIKRAEKDGAFDHLPGKGKPIQFDDDDISYNPQKRLNKIMKNNHILPSWVKLSKEIEALKEELKSYTVEYNIRKTVEEINKKIVNHNLSCPPNAQKRKLNINDYL